MVKYQTFPSCAERNVALIELVTVFFTPWYKKVMQHFRVLYVMK